MKQDNYTYHFSASQQAEIRAIRQKYLPPEEDRMVLLRRLDESVTRKGTAAALSLGVASTLLMGLGMSLCLVWGGSAFVPGIACGLLGMAGMGAAYPLYRCMIRRERAKLAPQILKLTEELLK